MATISQAVQPGLSVRRRWTVLAVCALSMFLVGLDTTVAVCVSVGVLIEGPRIGWASLLAWAGYLVAAAAAAGFTWAELHRREPLMDLGLLLLLAYLLIGMGFGFANAPITNTAVSGLPPERSGVAGAITSSARQVGSAIGIAIAGGLVTGVTPDGIARASRPGWLIVTACGLFLFAVAQAARPSA